MTEATEAAKAEDKDKSGLTDAVVRSFAHQTMVSLLQLEAEALAVRSARLARSLKAVRDAVGPGGELPEGMDVKTAKINLRSPKVIAAIGVVVTMPWLVGLWTLGRALLGGM